MDEILITLAVASGIFLVVCLLFDEDQRP